MAKGFQGFPGGGNMQQMMKQAQKMQQQMVKLQEELEERVYEASAGGGMVHAKVNGKREIVELTIDPQVIDPEDAELLQDMILAALNEALREGEETREEEMGRLSPGMGGLF